MIKFLIKKSFFDGWDNFLPLILSNLLYSLLILLFFFSSSLFSEMEIGSFALISAAFLLLFSTASLCTSGMAFEWGHYRRTWAQGLKNSLKKHFWHILFFFTLICLAFFCFIFIIPFYFSSHSYMGIFLAVMMFWFFVLFLPSMQYFFPLALFMPDDGVFLTFKKCLFLALDNKLFTLFVTFKTLVDFVISIGTCFLIPGFTGIAISHIDAVKLILLRYDYMRENAVLKSDINEYEMLKNERECVGPRTIRNLIFPWKNN